MKKTFKDIINELEAFVDDHYQPFEFGFGNISNISTKNHSFPLVFVQPIQSYNEGQMFRLKLEVYVMDIIRQDRTNELDVLNNTLLIANDLIIKYFDDEDLTGFVLDENNVSLSPFTADFDDNCGGWIVEVEIQIENDLNICDLPLASDNIITPTPTPTPATANLKIITQYNSINLPLTIFTIYADDQVTVVYGTDQTGAGGESSIPMTFNVGDIYWIECYKDDGVDRYQKVEFITITDSPLHTAIIELDKL